MRLTSVGGTLAALALAAAFFLDWVTVAPPGAQTFRAEVQKALGDAEAPSAARDDFLRLAETLAEEEALAGTDILLWIRTAHAYNAERAAEQARVGEGLERTQRQLYLARVLLYALPLAGLLLAAYFLVHRLRRARSPMLILSVLTGALAVGVAGWLDFTHHLVVGTLGDAAAGVRLGLGIWLLLGGGAALLLAGLFGVTVKNWFRVYAGSAATGACLALIAWQYLAKGLTL